MGGQAFRWLAYEARDEDHDRRTSFLKHYASAMF